jgi:hypothetical protein
MTSSEITWDVCDGRVWPNVRLGRLLGLVLHRELMVGKHNIKVGGSPHPLG